MGTGDLRRRVLATRTDNDLITSCGETNAFGVQANRDPFLLEDFSDGGGYVLVLVGDQSRALLYNCDIASETPEHLAELQADIAATHDYKMAREKIHTHHAAVG